MCATRWPRSRPAPDHMAGCRRNPAWRPESRRVAAGCDRPHTATTRSSPASKSAMVGAPWKKVRERSLLDLEHARSPGRLPVVFLKPSTDQRVSDEGIPLLGAAAVPARQLRVIDICLWPIHMPTIARRARGHSRAGIPQCRQQAKRQCTSHCAARRPRVSSCMERSSCAVERAKRPDFSAWPWRHKNRLTP